MLPPRISFTSKEFQRNRNDKHLLTNNQLSRSIWTLTTFIVQKEDENVYIKSVNQIQIQKVLRASTIFRCPYNETTIICIVYVVLDIDINNRISKKKSRCYSSKVLTYPNNVVARNRDKYYRKWRKRTVIRSIECKNSRFVAREMWWHASAAVENILLFFQKCGMSKNVTFKHHAINISPLWAEQNLRYSEQHLTM